MGEANVFISYRRDDTAKEVRRLRERLKKTQQSVFLETSNIQGGERFPKKLERALSEADVVVVAIGKSWLEASDSMGNRRLQDPDDFVRREILDALERAETDAFFDIIPVLISGAKMPRKAALPRALKGLAALSALTIESGRFNECVDELSERIDTVLGEHEERADFGLDEIDGYLSAKDMSLSDATSMSPTFARDPELHDLPEAAEWVCTRGRVFELRFETFDNFFFEGRQTRPDGDEVEGRWRYKPGRGQTLVMELLGKTVDGSDFFAEFPIEEKVGQRSYGGRDNDGQYYRLKCVHRKDQLERTF